MNRKWMSWLGKMGFVMVFPMLGGMSAAPSFAQSLATVSGTAVQAPAAPIVPQNLLIVSNVTPLTPDSWIKIGKNFGSNGEWQFGFDKSSTVGACAGYAVRAHIMLAGPCRDVFILAGNSVPVFHLGGSILYSGQTPNYTGRLGFNVGPVAAAGLNYVSNNVPYLDSISGVSAPAWLAYVGKITTVDYMVGRINGKLDHGPQLKFDIPLPDLEALLPAFSKL